MKLGAMMHAVTDMGNDRRPFHEGVRMIREAGYDYISFLSVPGAPALQDPSDEPPRSLIDIVRSDPKALLQVVRDNGLETLHLHAGAYLVDDEAAMKASLDYMKRVVDAALSLGIRYVSSGVTQRPEWGEPGARSAKSAYLDRLARLFEDVAAYIGDADLRVSVDTHYTAVAESVEECLYLLDRTDPKRTGLCLNMGHLATAGHPGWELVEARPDRIVVAAWKDHVITPGVKRIHSVRMGRGSTPFRRYQAAFRKVDSAAFHVHSFEGESYEEKGEALAESYRYWKRMWAEESWRSRDERK